MHDEDAPIPPACCKIQSHPRRQAALAIWEFVILDQPFKFDWNGVPAHLCENHASQLIRKEF
jgi:hypothetical protein